MIDRPLSPAEFAAQHQRLQNRIRLKRAWRESAAAEIARLKQFVHEQLRAELRAQRDARREESKRDTRQLALLEENA